MSKEKTETPEAQEATSGDAKQTPTKQATNGGGKELKPKDPIELAFGLFYHGIAHPITALALLTTENNVKRCASMLKGIESAFQMYQSKKAAAEAISAPSAQDQQTDRSEILAQYRDDQGNVVVRGFAPDPSPSDSASKAMSEPASEPADAEATEQEDEAV